MDTVNGRASAAGEADGNETGAERPGTEAASRAVGELATTAAGWIRERPLTALVVAGVAGFVVARVLRHES